MMKQSAIPFALAALMLTACSHDENPDTNNPVAATFTAGINLTRASVSTWDAGDAIGIYMVANGGTSTVHAANTQYTAAASGTNGTFNAVAVNEIYYPQSGKVDFISYYPYDGSLSGDTYNVNVATQTTPAEIDLLWAKADNSGTGYDKGNTSAVALGFSHKLTKLVLKTTAGAGVNSLTGMTVSIKGMNTTNTFDVKAGTFGTAAAPAPITPLTVTDGAQYEAIILERTVAALGDVTVEFTVDGDVFVWQVPAGTAFNSGEEHTWNITIKRTGIDFTGTITNWTTGTGGTGDAE